MDTFFGIYSFYYYYYFFCSFFFGFLASFVFIASELVEYLLVYIACNSEGNIVPYRGVLESLLNLSQEHGLPLSNSDLVSHCFSYFFL